MYELVEEMAGRIRPFDVAAFVLVCFAGVYSGTQFFEPIIIDQLEKDGNLRKDIEIPKYDEEGVPVAPKSMLELKEELNRVLEQKNSERSAGAASATSASESSE